LDPIKPDYFRTVERGRRDYPKKGISKKEKKKTGN